MRIKPQKRLLRETPQKPSVPETINQCWQYRLFNVLDDFNREGLGIEVDFSLPAERVIRSLEQIIEWRGNPSAIRCDNGLEYISKLLVEWSEEHNITLLFIQP